LSEHTILEKIEIPDSNEAQVSDLIDFLNQLDKRITVCHDLLGNLRETVAEEAVVNDNFSKASEVKFRRLNTEIGSKPSNLDAKFNAPNLWSLLSAMHKFVGDKLGELGSMNTSIDGVTHRLSEVEREQLKKDLPLLKKVLKGWSRM
jgi:hypothetical protein